MGLSELESKRVEKLASEYIDAHRPPPLIRSQLDIGFRISNQSLELFEIGPRWDNPGEILEHDFVVRPKNTSLPLNSIRRKV